jgi:acetolactate synthase-1/2/3 large subunit
MRTTPACTLQADRLVQHPLELTPLIPKESIMTEPTLLSGARYIAETLKGYGVTHVFYVDAMLRKAMVDMEELGIRRVVTHSEKAAAYMADGYARISGRAGVCMAQSVGAANLAAGLQDAFLASSPVIALTGKKPPLWQYRNAYQEINHWPMFEPVTKFNADVVNPEQLPMLLRQAFREAVSGKPGPVHLDMIGREARELEIAAIPASVTLDERYIHTPPFRPAPDPDALAAAARAIEGASRPVIVAGGGVRISGAAAELMALAEKCSIPVATSVDGKGSIPENHPLSVGVVGNYSAWCANKVVSEADLVIYIGSATGDQTTNSWKVPAMSTSIVQIDIDPAELGRSYPHTIGVLGDAKASLQHLAAALPQSAGHAGWLARTRELVKEWLAAVNPLRFSDERPIRPERICKELTEALPENGIMVSDTGYSAIWAATMLHLTHPTQTFIRAAGSLGWSFPAALGAKCATPDRPVICFTGDGGFWYHFAELETARRHHIYTVTVVNNNNGFSQGIEDVHKMYGDRPGDRTELYRFEPVSFAQIARDMGCFGIRVESPEAIGPAIQQALGAGAPAVVEVVTDFSARVPAPWAPK